VRDFELPRDRPTGEEAGEVADRLDALTMDKVERVLRRAIELQSDDEHGRERLRPADIQKVAQELGIDAAHVRRALFEEETEPTEPTLYERAVAPNRVSERTTIKAGHGDVTQAANAWLERHEGLRMRRALPDGGVWEKDPSALTSIRMGLKLGRGSGALRSVGPVTHRVRAIDAGEQIVSLEADTSLIGKVAAGLTAGGAGLGLIALLVMAANGEGFAALATGIGVTIAGIGAALTTARVWTRRIRQGLRRALDAIASPSVSGVFESVPDRVAGVVRNILQLGRDVKRRL
jgi:hypothetical protein